MATGDVFGVKLHMTFAEQECRPGFYLIEGSGGSDPDPVFNCADAVKTALGAGALAGFSAATTLTAIEVSDIQPGTGRTVILNYFPVEEGDIPDDNPVAPQDSMLLEWITAFKGGKGKFARRGRSYIPGIYGTGQISGFLIADLQTALSAFGQHLVTAFIDDGSAYQMHAVAFVPNTNPREIQEVNPMVEMRVDNHVAIQRRRRPGKGI